MKTSLLSRWIVLLSLCLPALLAGSVRAQSVVPEYFFPENLWPPPNGVYISTAQKFALYANGIIIRDVRHRFFTQHLPPPSLGTTQTHTFGSQVDFEVSFDNGATFQPASVPANATVRVTHTSDSGVTNIFDTEMLALNILGGTLPPGMMIRESPTLASTGQTTMRPVTGGFMISSFFDIFTEVSLDGGSTWSPSTGPGRMQLTAPAPEIAAPTPKLPPPDGVYLGPAQWFARYANEIIITNVTQRAFTQAQPLPPPGETQFESFFSMISGLISTNGGATFSPFSASADSQVRVTSMIDAGNTRFFDTEMLALNISGGSLPGGLMLRESPTKASVGRTSVRTVSGSDYRISSFFDIFTEISPDGGATWSPSIAEPGTLALSPNPAAISVSRLTNPIRLGNGSFQFDFTNTPGASFTTLATTNVSFPLSNWTVLGTPTEAPPGQYQFTDLQASNLVQRFYRVRLP